MIAYLETSAAAKLITGEPERETTRAYLDAIKSAAGHVVSSSLLETELRRTAVREGLPQEHVTELLDHVDVFELPRSTFVAAGILTGEHLRSLDAIHITAALVVEADVLVTLDKRQADAATAVGMRVHSPA